MYKKKTIDLIIFTTLFENKKPIKIIIDHRKKTIIHSFIHTQIILTRQLPNTILSTVKQTKTKNKPLFTKNALINHLVFPNKLLSRKHEKCHVDRQPQPNVVNVTCSH